MTRIIKKYWIWNEKYNTTEFKLGDNIQKFISEGKVIPNTENPLEFFGLNNYPWVIKVDEAGLINSIFFRETFVNLMENEIWDFEYEKFTKYMDNILEPKIEDDNNSKDFLYVVFRGGFVTIAEIKRVSNL